MSNRNEPIQARNNLDASKNFQKRNKKRREEVSFGQKEIDIKSFIIAPEGYETFMFIIYFLTIPYLAGLTFLYLFIAQASFTHFLNFKISSYFVIWAIGYEVVAAITLVLIAYAFTKSFKSIA
ncbi:MAG: hypothetical protein PF439_10975 [Helicobacteraceae bacterium]|nr:hypothetical protein [Helicobacteraceae bacterium]